MIPDLVIGASGAVVAMRFFARSGSVRTVSFFDTPPIPEPPPEPAQPPQPEWMGAPQGVLPGRSSEQATLFKTDEALLLVQQFLAYPTGIEFTFNLWLRNPDHPPPAFPWDLHGQQRTGPLPDDFLRLGILLSDGMKWTNVDWTHPERNEQPAGLHVSPRGGGGGGDRFRMSYWMWPLPPEGPMTFVASWPSQAVEERSVTVDATELRARATEAEIIWPT